MNTKLKILACQIEIPPMQTAHERDRHVENTVLKIRHQLENERHDLVVLPELSSIDYSRTAFDRLSLLAEPVTGPTYEKYRGLAREYDVCIVYGIAKKSSQGFTICQVVIGANGEIIGHFDKLHVANFGYSFEKQYFNCGEHLFVFEHKGIRISPIICYDIRIPELVRTLTIEHNVQLILHCGAYGRDESFYSWHHFVVTRALENQLYILSLNRAGKNFGNSLFCPPWVDETAPPHQFPAYEESMQSIIVDSKTIDEVRNKYSFLADRFDNYNQLMKAD